MNKYNYLFICGVLLATLFLNSCEKDNDPPDDFDPTDTPMDTTQTPTDTTTMDTMDVVEPTWKVWEFSADDYTATAIQDAFIDMEAGDTVKFGAGVFSFETGLSIDDKNNVVIMGAGMDETILDFSNQIDVAGSGAEGLKVTANNTILAKFTVRNTIGDAIKVKDSEHFTFYKIKVEWTDLESEDNGAYGLYPVSSRHILIDGCVAIGASDAGLYVGQCEHVIVKNSHAERNVAGIEIENTKHADVFNNTAVNNTGGLLVFDLPGLPAGQGSHTRVYNNIIENNSLVNFAPEGNVVGYVPPGTGIMLMACNNVEVFGNSIGGNNVMSIGLVNYEVLRELGAADWDDPTYIPHPRAVNVHDNIIIRSNDCPENLNFMGTFLTSIFDDCEMPEVLYDGIIKPEDYVTEEAMCLKNNGPISVGILDLGGYPDDFTPYMAADEFDCTKEGLPDVEVEAPVWGN